MSTTNLRIPIVLLAGAIFSFAASLRAAPAADAAPKRPNILFCIADDWSFPHAGAYGDRVVKTPTFDRVAAEGVLFTRSFCATPSCSPSRAALLTGQMPHRLEEGGNLWGSLPAKFPVYTDALEAAGYRVGYMGKGWGPGQLGDRKRNAAGQKFGSFEQFLKTVPAGEPFCFWFGSTDPHRPYEPGAGIAAGMRPGDVTVPGWLPDTPEVRSDVLDYYTEVQRFDRDCGQMLKLLEAAGQLDNTIVVMTSDNGMPFPRAKTNLHDSGTHLPLAMRWPAKAKGGRKLDLLVSHTDLAPTFLEAAGLKPWPEMTGRSLLEHLTGDAAAPREAVFVERERHANVRKGDLSYPVRACRTDQFLYVRNFRPDLWPAGDPDVWKAVGPYGDIDSGPSKSVVIKGKDDPRIAPFFALAAAKRPEEELYDLRKDPDQVHNVAGQPEYAAAQKGMRGRLDRWMTETADPRAQGGGAYDKYDKYPYFGGPPAKELMNQPK